MANAAKKPTGLRTFQDDFAKLNPDATQHAPVTSSDNASEHITATEPRYDHGEKKHDTSFADIDVKLTDNESAAEITEEITKDVAKHTLDIDDELEADRSPSIAKPPIQISVDENLLTEKNPQSTTEDELVEDSDANIIRETRDEEFQLFPAIVASIREWFTRRKQTKQEIEDAKPTVINPEARKERLREAARNSALPTFTETLITNKATVHEDKLAADSEGINIKAAQAPEAVGWSHIIDDGEETDTTSDAATIETKPDVVPNTPSAVPAKPTASPNISADLTEEVVPVTKYETAPSLAISEETSVPTESPLPSRPIQDSADSSTLNVSQFNSEIRPSSAAATVTADTDTLSTTRNESRVRTYTLLATAIFVAILLGGALAFVLYSFFTTTRSDTVTTVESIVITDAQVSISAINPYTFLTDATNTIAQYPNQTIFFYPTITNSDGEVLLLTPNQLLQPLNTSMEQSLLRSIEAIAFGATRESVPFLVIKVNNFDVALAGMLEWENFIAEDLAPFFGEATTEVFTDTSTNNQDIRRTERLDGTVLLYSFINKNTIIITDSVAALPEIKLILQ